MKIIIDTAAIAHRIRRLWWRLIRPEAGAIAQWRCFGCGKHLTAVEREHYGISCERCEGHWMRKADKL